jgi:uncharacterized membrane protein
MAGIFGLYSHTIMRGLRRTDDRTFVAAFQQIDRAIINPWFLTSYLGALVFTLLAATLHLGERVRAVLPWILAALVLYFVVFIITFVVNVPRNDALKAAGEPDQISDPAEVRERFNEALWARWNLVRTLASTVAFGCLAWALVVYGGTS